jgi:hypothetical protein
MKKVAKQVDDLSARLASADESPVMQSQVYRGSFNNWEDNIHHIDFDGAKKITDTLLEKYGKQEGAALFFLHNSQKMGGKWFLRCVKSKLQNLPFSAWSAPFECRIDSPPGGDPTVFLSRLSARFSPQSECKNEQEQIDKIVDKIYQALERSHVFLISITIEQIRPQDKFLEWFVNQFWSVIVKKLSEVTGERPLIRIIGVISVEAKVANQQIPKHLCCSVKQFAQEKMIELPLKSWNKVQIRAWLEAHSSLNPREISEHAETIYTGADKGMPFLVYDKLMTKITMEAS